MSHISTRKCFAIGLLAVLLVSGGRTVTAQSVSPLRIEKGTKLMLDLQTEINSATTREGDAVLFLVRSDIMSNGRVAIPRGTPVKATATQVEPAFVNGKPRKAEIHIHLDVVSLNDGASLPLEARDLVLKAETPGRQISTMQAAVGPAMIGGLIGNSIGGLFGSSGMAAGIGAIAAIGISTIETSREPRLRGSEVDSSRDAVFETRLKHSLEISDPSLFAALPVAAPRPPLPLIASTRAVLDEPLAYAETTSSETPSKPASREVSADVPATTESAPPSSDVRSATGESGVFSLSLDVNRVLVDAVVSNRAGQPMPNLHKEDFRLFEDGVEQPIRDFTRDELPLAVALVIDRSGSVAPQMNRVQAAAFQALQQLKRDDEVCLITFAADVDVLEELTTDRNRIAGRIGMIRASGGTAIVDALDEAFRYLAQKAPDRRRAVILISDNMEGRSYTTLNEAKRHASEAEVVVYSVKIGQASVPLLPGVGIPGYLPPVFQAAKPVLDPVASITQETGGEIFATNASAIDMALGKAISRLKLRYTLGYAPLSNSGRSYHSIKVQLVDRFGKAGSDYTVHSRSGYYGGVRAAAD